LNDPAKIATVLRTGSSYPQITQILQFNLCNLWIKQVASKNLFSPETNLILPALIVETN